MAPSWKSPCRRALLAALVLLAPGQAPADAPAEARAVFSAESLVGVVVAARTLDLAPRVDGRLEVLRVRLGDRVAAHQEVATLERQPLSIELAARQAGVKAAEAEYSRSQVLLTQARQRLEREQRVREYTAAEAVETAENQVALAASDVALAQARLAQAQAQLDQVATQLEHTRVRAPFAGFVSEIFIYPGAQVGQSTPVLRIVSEELRLRVAIPASLASLARPGAVVQARLEALNLVVTGVLENVSPELDPASRHLKAEARLEVPAAHRGRIPSGLLAQVELRGSAVPAGMSGTSTPP
jgi:membrane fusion protein, multidrug efflux system